MSYNFGIVSNYDETTKITSIGTLFEFPFNDKDGEDHYGVRFICSKKQDEYALFIYMEYFGAKSGLGGSWILLRKGNLQITINDSENIILEPYEEITADNKDGCVRETVSYALTKDQLKIICDADSVSLKITGQKKEYVVNCSDFCRVFPSDKFGGDYYWTSGELDKMKDRISFCVKAKKEKISFVTFARRFYNAAFDGNAYLDSLEIKEPVKEPVKESSSCLITLLMTLGTISAFFAAIGVIVNAFLV